MNDDTKMPHKLVTYFGLIILAAVLTAFAAHALQMLILGEASAVVSGGAAGGVAGVTAFGLRKRKKRIPDEGDTVA